MANIQLLEKIDAAIAEKNLLKHPFYQDWQAGKLSRESLHHFGHFLPRRAFAVRAVPAFGEYVILRLWQRRADRPKPVLVEEFINRSIPEAVAALYAYEAQVPEIATTKMDGLNRFYGINDAKGTAYFAVHEEADKAHRAAWRNWLIENVGGNEEQILASTRDALSALWGALDAVHSGSCAKN